MQPQVWSVSADFLWYEKCIKIQIMSNWTTIQFAQLPISIFVNNMLQHVSTCWKQGWIIMNYINIRKWHAIKQVHKQVSSGNVTAVSVALCSGAGAGVCSSAKMNAHDCTKEKVVHNDTICIYIIKYIYIYKHQNTTSYIIILRYWQYSRENPSCFHLTSLNSITGATNSLFHTCLHYTIRSQTISNHLKASQSILNLVKKNVRKWKGWKKNISTTSCPTIPHTQRLGAQLQPQQVDPQILLPEKVPASKTCKWNAQNIETN